MRLKCNECGNTCNFTASAQANIEVMINRFGRVIDARASQQTLSDIIVIKPCKCNVCGCPDKIIDEDQE